MRGNLDHIVKHRRDLKSQKENQVLFPFNVIFFLQIIDCRAFLRQDLLVLRWQDYLTFGTMPLSNMNECVCVCVCVCARARARSVVSEWFAAQWTVACQATLSMEFFR